MNKRIIFGIKKRRVAYFIFINPKIVMQKNTDFTRFVGQIADRYAPQKYIFVARHRVV